MLIIKIRTVIIVACRWEEVWSSAILTLNSFHKITYHGFNDLNDPWEILSVNWIPRVWILVTNHPVLVRGNCKATTVVDLQISYQTAQLLLTWDNQMVETHMLVVFVSHQPVESLHESHWEIQYTLPSKCYCAILTRSEPLDLQKCVPHCWPVSADIIQCCLCTANSVIISHNFTMIPFSSSATQRSW